MKGRIEMKLSKILTAFFFGLVLGGTKAFAWSGFGTADGVCVYTGSSEIPGAHQFTPFAYWEGHSSAETVFSGFWRDDATGEQGLFQGSWHDPAPPPAASFFRESKGGWYRLIDGSYVLMGTYEMKCEVWYTGNASGTWSVDCENWQGQGSTKGDDPDIPPSDGE
jgi:hypothetical protein